MTERCADFIGEQRLVDTFIRIAQNVGCDEKTVRTLASERIVSLAATHRPKLPAWLGIDETTIDGKLRLVLTDIQGLPATNRSTGSGAPERRTRWRSDF
jgi:transposase